MADPTMRDVAIRAGVGLGTVSRVVNGGNSVRPQTAERVRSAIAELGFRRNEVARALRPGMKSAMLALLLGDLTNPFYATIAKSAVEVARARGHAVMVTSVDEDPEAELRAVNDLLSRRVAGLMIVPDQSGHEFLQPALDAGTPVVFVDRPASGIDADSVLLDNERGGWLATNHLLGHGHRRIAILIAPSYYTTGRRLRGYRRALREAGIDVDEGLVITLPAGTSAAAEAATDELMHRADRPTAIFATTNFLAEGTLRALGRRPGRVHPAVVGFDDFRLAGMLPVPATVVAGNVDALGRQATGMLLDRIDGADGPPQRLVLPVELIARGSGELPPPRGQK